MNPKFILASASPRRKEILESLNLEFLVKPADINEHRKPNEKSIDYVARLAAEKSLKIAKTVDLPVLGSDTIVCHSEVCFGKPKNKHDAFTIWRSLSGDQHQVLTALALVKGQEIFTELSISTVKFKEINESEMEQYWQSGEPQDKAGAYGIQGLAAAWIESIEGSHSGIVGLPLFELNRLLKNIHLNWL